MSMTIRRTLRHFPAPFLVLFLFGALFVFRYSPGWWTMTSVALLVAGTLLNLLVIGVNDGYMPARAGEDELPPEKRDLYKPIDGDTRLTVLSDWIAVGGYLISPGDLLIGLALGVLVLDDLLYYF
jgi:hypothetical protein